MNAPFLIERAGGVHLAVKLQPRASRQQITGVHGSELKISVTAPPVDAAANRALVEFIAELLQVSRSRVSLIRGQTSRHKTVLIADHSAAQIFEKLQAYLV
jgi:uncharacterized protein (TIGR00251 family)